MTPQRSRRASSRNLRQNYSFNTRTFGQGVSTDEIAAFIQDVPGVIAVNVTGLTARPDEQRRRPRQRRLVGLCL